MRIDEAAIKAEEKLDGKYLLRSSDPELSAADIALGYKQLAEVERGWRDMKQVLDLRPVYHRREDRIRAHVVLCWLALLLVRVIETTCEDTWPTCAASLRSCSSAASAAPPAASVSAPRSRLPSAPSSRSSSSPSRRASASSRRQRQPPELRRRSLRIDTRHFRARPASSLQNRHVSWTIGLNSCGTRLNLLPTLLR